MRHRKNEMISYNNIDDIWQTLDLVESFSKVGWSSIVICGHALYRKS